MLFMGIMPSFEIIENTMSMAIIIITTINGAP
jgi:hypothetical protein